MRRQPQTAVRTMVAVLLMTLFAASGLLAQEQASRLPIFYGEEVAGTISSEVFFDHWLLDAETGEQVRVTMTGSDGLSPLIGILDPGQNLQATSTEGAVNGAVSLTYTIPQRGTYTIVATRAGSQIGTTTGSYRMLIDNLNPQPIPTPDAFSLIDGPFTCGETTAVSFFAIDFGREEFDAVSYSVRVYGFDGFQPVLQIQTDSETPICITTPANALGDQVSFPGEPAITLTDADLAATVQHILTEPDFTQGFVRLTVGNLGDADGRFAMVIGGFRIEPAADFDPFTIQLSPEAVDAGRSAVVYAIGVNNRLDPRVEWAEAACDDAGRRTCEDVPPITGSGVVFNEGVSVLGDRFDAGTALTTGDYRIMSVISFGGTTRGEYALLVYGE